jgi:hypothetical protein
MTLSERIAVAIEDGRPRTAVEIARLTRARNADVRRALEADARFAITDTPGGRRSNGRYWRMVVPVPNPGSRSRALNGVGPASEPSRISGSAEAVLWRLQFGPKCVGEALERKRA